MSLDSSRGDAPSSLHRSFRMVADRLAADVGKRPRRMPGSLDVGGRELRYVDLHSVYWQIRQIVADGLYDIDLPTEAPVILDCGAHIGIASLFFAERFPAATIHAFEADPTIADALAFNLTSFGMNRVTAHRCAVWTGEGTVRFSASQDDSGHVAPEADSALTVPAIRLRDWIAGHRIDLLKLDIEGGEFAVLADCDGALDGVGALLAELHLFGHADAGLGGLLSLLERNGFHYALSDLHQATWLPCANPPPFRHLRTDRFLVTVYAWR